MTSCKCYPNFIQIFWKTRFILILLNVNSKTSNVRSSNKVPSLPQQPQLAFLKSRFWNWDLLLQLLLQLPLRPLWMILSKAIETSIILLITDITPTNQPIQISCLNFKAVLALPKMAGSAQIHKVHISFIWIVRSTLSICNSQKPTHMKRTLVFWWNYTCFHSLESEATAATSISASVSGSDPGGCSSTGYFR